MGLSTSSIFRYLSHFITCVCLSNLLRFPASGYILDDIAFMFSNSIVLVFFPQKFFSERLPHLWNPNAFSTVSVIHPKRYFTWRHEGCVSGLLINNHFH